MEKKWVRPTDRRVLAGVCQGLSDYTEVDVGIIRLIAVLIFLFSSGTIFVVYIIMIFVLPLDSNEPPIIINAKTKKDDSDIYAYDPEDYDLEKDFK